MLLELELSDFLDQTCPSSIMTNHKTGQKIERNLQFKPLPGSLAQVEKS